MIVVQRVITRTGSAPCHGKSHYFISCRCVL